MTDPSRYERAVDSPAPRRRLLRYGWVLGAVLVLAAMVIVVVLLTGIHDPSQFQHG